MAQLGTTQYYKVNTNGIDQYLSMPYGGNTPTGYQPISKQDYISGLQSRIAQQQSLQQQGLVFGGGPKQLSNGQWYQGEVADPNTLNKLQTELQGVQSGTGIHAQGYIDPQYTRYNANATTPDNNNLTPEAKAEYDTSNAAYQKTLAYQQANPLTQNNTQNKITPAGQNQGVGTTNNLAGTGQNQNTSTTNTANTSNTYNTGDPKQDALLQQLKDYITQQQATGNQINPALNLDQSTIDAFLTQAQKEIHPYYAQQIGTIKQDVLRQVPQLAQNYQNDVAGAQAKFQQNLGNYRENQADAGTAFSGARAQGELGQQSSQDRSLQNLSQTYGNSLYDLGRTAEKQIGAGNVDYTLPSVTNYSSNLGGNGSFDQGASTTPYTSGSYQMGEIPMAENQNAQQLQSQLVSEAYQRSANGQSYQDLFK